MKELVRCSMRSVLTAILCAPMAQAQTETHANLQSVTAMGASAWAGSYPFTIRGVILNNPEDMLDSTWDSQAESLNRMGAEFQVFIQSAASGDRGGSALWLGQNYQSRGNVGHIYSEEKWSNEMLRVNYDLGAGHHFRAGDLVEVTVNQSLFYGGKRNINEGHRTNDANNFIVSLVEAGRGLPDPEAIALSNLVSDGANQIFDAMRQSGGNTIKACVFGLKAFALPRTTSERTDGARRLGTTAVARLRTATIVSSPCACR